MCTNPEAQASGWLGPLPSVACPVGRRGVHVVSWVASMEHPVVGGLVARHGAPAHLVVALVTLKCLHGCSASPARPLKLNAILGVLLSTQAVRSSLLVLLEAAHPLRARRGHAHAREERRGHGHVHHAVLTGGLLEARRVQEGGKPVGWQVILREWDGIVYQVGADLAAIRLLVEECAQVSTRTPATLEVTAHQCPEVVRVVELLLRAVRVRTSGPQGATLGVGQARVFLVPEGAQLVSVPDLGRPPGILVGVGIHASLPIVLGADWAPQSLEAPCEEFFSQRLRCVGLLLCRQERRCDLITGVGEGATPTMAAPPDVWEGRAEAVLLLSMLPVSASTSTPL
mmetsp:Transcript_168103/g.539876  ORF Transcript_168103/g.539876 Transcript_168103/m.539876 type:complete len:342 (+) Transcript_168103:144-1169(+)